MSEKGGGKGEREVREGCVRRGGRGGGKGKERRVERGGGKGCSRVRVRVRHREG